MGEALNAHCEVMRSELSAGPQRAISSAGTSERLFQMTVYSFCSAVLGLGAQQRTVNNCLKFGFRSAKHIWRVRGLLVLIPMLPLGPRSDKFQQRRLHPSHYLLVERCALGTGAMPKLGAAKEET